MIEFQARRPTIRDAVIALEVQGLVEVRVGPGAHVVRLPGQTDQACFPVTAFELTEARLAFESEAAALAAIQISDDELNRLDDLSARMVKKTGDVEDADREFHLTIARATRNAAMDDIITRLWDMRANSPNTKLLLAQSRSAKVRPVVDGYKAIASAMRSRDPGKARAAMRAHLAAVHGRPLATKLN